MRLRVANNGSSDPYPDFKSFKLIHLISGVASQVPDCTAPGEQLQISLWSGLFLPGPLFKSVSADVR